MRRTVTLRVPFASLVAAVCAALLAAMSASSCARRRENPPRSEVPAPQVDAGAPAVEAASDGAAPDVRRTAPAGYPPPSRDDRPAAGVVPADLVAGWVPDDAPRTYVPDDLHMLVDGGDGVFLQYGFAWAERRTYRPEQAVASRVRVEVYAFSSAAGALGRYDHESREGGGAPWSAEPPPEALASKVDAARLDADQLRLARGRFLAILRYEDDAETDVARLIAAAHDPLLAFAAALAARFSQGAADAGP